MNDILPGEVERWHALEAVVRDVVRTHGYREIRTPLIEPTPLFVRSVGEGTDIVDKEMYSFVFHDEPLTVRPEGTASVVRAYIEHALHTKEPVSRLYYEGPMFRGERPARGRTRQFHQAGCEVLGDPGPGIDAEMIDMIVGLYRRLGVKDVEVLVNSLGGRGTKARYRDVLIAHLEPLRSTLSDDSQRRIGVNPLRVLDSKHPKDQEAIASAPSILDVLDDEDRKHFDGLCALLDQLGTPYKVEPRLVRGLDYYARTLFEVRGHGGELGAQNALCGGGRYDGLPEELGGPAVPAIGFAMGLERALLAMPETRLAVDAPVLIAPLGERAAARGLVLARTLREAGLTTICEARGGTLKAMLRRANAFGSRVAVVLGDAELDKGVVQLKDLASHTQQEVPEGELPNAIRGVFASPAAPPKTGEGT